MSTLNILRRASTGQQAEPMEDYIPVSQSLTFQSGDMLKTVRVTILDDRSMPMVEGQESFSLQLRFPDQAILGRFLQLYFLHLFDENLEAV